MGTVSAITSGKGGTGKTSITGGVAASLALMGRRVLCIDMDVGLRRFGLPALHVAAFYRQFVALLQCGQCRRRIVRPLLRLPPDFAPAALSDDCAFGDELHAAALQPCRRYLFDADPAEGFEIGRASCRERV